MNHCACGIWTLKLRFSLTFSFVDMQNQDSHQDLVGDLVFKLNPGPVVNSTSRIALTVQNNNIHRYKSFLSSCNSLTMSLLNIRSLRNKTANFVDYVCETKVDLFAITETWLCQNDDVIRNESCPFGYVLADHSRTGRRGGGTALVYRNSFIVKKIIRVFQMDCAICISQSPYHCDLPTAVRRRAQSSHEHPFC